MITMIENFCKTNNTIIIISYYRATKMVLTNINHVLVLHILFNLCLLEKVCMMLANQPGIHRTRVSTHTLQSTFSAIYTNGKISQNINNRVQVLK